MITSILYNNPCYKAGKKLNVKGIMLHSVGCPQPNPSVFARSWNKSNMNVCVHGFIGAEETVITLPYKPGEAIRGWHCGKGNKGSMNDTHLAFEMCEPANITYTSGANFICKDEEAARAMVEKATQNAITLFAQICKLYSFNPLEPGVIVSHSEGNKMGKASAHADPEHLWKQLDMNWTMDSFRAAVKKKMGNPANTSSTTTSSSIVSSSLVIGQEVRLRSGTRYTNGKKIPNWVIKSKLYVRAIKGNNITVSIYKTGAITGIVPISAIFTPYTIVVNTNILNVRKAPNTSSAIVTTIKKGWKYTIVEEEGEYGRLKSGAGWINLGYTKREKE